MIFRLVFSALLGALLSCAPAHAQVIEIDDSGEARTFDGPTLHMESGSAPIQMAERPTLSVRSSPATLLSEAAQVHGIDLRLLEAVAWQESRGRMDAVSAKGALGVMQLMPSTAAELGVDPNNLADNIRGGAMYLRQQLDRFGSLPLALAAYNAGPGAVVRYGGVPPYRETRDYVTKVMSRLGLVAAPVRVQRAQLTEVPGL